MVSRERAKYGAEAFPDMSGNLPSTFPRMMGRNCMNYLKEVIDSGLTCDLVGRFETAFARELGVENCIATPGCTPALAALAAAFDFDPGDEIIVSPVTDYGTIQGLVRENYIPVFADTEPGIINLNAETIEPCITDRTRAILVVHKTGIICDMDPINDLAEDNDLIVYEDACQAIFGEYKGRYAGTLSKAAGFSFDAEKTMGSDVGGCVVTDDHELAERIRFIGQSRGARMESHFGRKHIAPGYAYRMPQCTAAICLAQLENIKENVKKIDSMSRLLSGLIEGIPGVYPLPLPDYLDVYSCWMFGMTIDSGDFSCSPEEFANQLSEAGIPGAGQGKYYLMPLACTFLEERARNHAYPYSHPPASRNYRYRKEMYPNATAFLDEFIRWSTFCEKWQSEDCQLASRIINTVADGNRKG